jgi:uncharacterized protein YkvS
MKYLAITCIFLLTVSKIVGQDNQNLITYDIDNFWDAYDKITATNDSVAQYNYLNKLFIEKGSPGLKAIMEVRQYTDKSYIDAIKSYPLFWKSIRGNTLKAKEFAEKIQNDIDKLKKIYPDLKSSKIYFTIGALRTGGTTLNGMVLIGSEIAMADENTVTTEFSSDFSHLAPYFKTNPINSLAFGNTHEYVHTQQKTTIGDNLLAQSVLEGVAEFVAVLGTGKQSTTPSIEYGRKNNKQLSEKFAVQMFNSFTGFWLYSNSKNEFSNVRDLGYYMGYAICEKYYNNAKDKNKAIKQMIELDYNNEQDLEKFVDQSKYFNKSIKKLKAEFEKTRPTVVKILELKNGDTNVKSNVKEITIVFSKPLNENYRSFDLGPLGETNLLHLTKFVGFSEDKKSVTFEIELKPNQQYQIVVGSGFRSKEAYPISLKPYLIDFRTSNE